LAIILAGCNSGSGKKADENQLNNSNVVYLTDETFKELVFDYEKHGTNWQYAGTKPAVIDFYADWCAPCRKLSPLLEEVAGEYEGRMILYKVDTEKEPELTRKMGVEALPTLLYIPVEGKPQVRMGLASKDGLRQAFDEILFSK
jgi:thioredoxin